jgi:hypothetical protein
MGAELGISLEGGLLAQLIVQPTAKENWTKEYMKIMMNGGQIPEHSTKKMNNLNGKNLVEGRP